MWQNWALLSSSALPVFFEAIESMSHQLWEGAEIPIGITNVDMPEVGRQGRETRFYLEPTAVPVQQGLHGEAMTIIPSTELSP
jgi:hypothetical protein